ncbi:hypothetical protein [Rickettsiella massiliensis]|uniref:hypothetical protein n=1 Tax=Rickettsiella massiliensis TaxID=676517 RepID=UPI00029A575E|nr:hypothetical protein [Rickettsiella massiliensis]
MGAERSHYYIYNKENYIRVLLALKEIEGSPCLEERLHQLTYYTNHQMWDKLNTELRLLVNLNPEVKVDYTALLMSLHDHAVNTLRGEAQENMLEIIEKFRKDCVNKVHLQSTEQKKRVFFCLS